MIMTFDPEPVDSGFVVIFVLVRTKFCDGRCGYRREGGGLGGLPPPF